MKDCKFIRESLGAWLDGELSASDAELVSLHLESCAPCEKERRQLEKLNVSLQSLLVANVSPIAFEPFWDGVQNRITAVRSWREGVMEWARSVFTGPALA